MRDLKKRFQDACREDFNKRCPKVKAPQDVKGGMKQHLATLSENCRQTCEASEMFLYPDGVKP